ncbi:hypothetical protein [Nitrosovibrio sp. Nv4]|uniref:hypothetical protein n=1 Tax=Nitrosovibrio sp. Nv4 TaxID=1945880 RepID=UPI000BCD52BE|nr:hypothetical protein [Nitrosovibrio sp. Nv4]SOD42426.1 hypothetical protein SAMN06298226_2765 [Nitrosovibrio sp. Nv4]
MSDREQFEKWSDENVGFLTPFNAWQARQPEIDALRKQLTESVVLDGAWETSKVLADKVYALQQENAAIKAEVDRLRNKVEAPSFFLLGLTSSPNVPEVFRQAALMHYKSLHAAMKETKTPKFDKTFCSNCGGEFGPGDHGYSYCESHEGQRRIG